jgi:GT2 family glycosyltransferase
MNILISTANYNSEKDTLFFLDSLNELAKKNGLNKYHVQIFDNSRSLTNLASYEYIKYDVISPKKNLGLAPTWRISLNFFKKNDFDLIVLINNDTQFTDNFFDELQKALDQEPLSVFSPYIVLENGKPWSTGGKFGVFPWVIKHEAKLKKEYESSLINTEHLSGCCLIIPKNVISTYPHIYRGVSDFFFRGEEWFFNKRLHDEDIKRIVLRDAILIHRENGSHQRFSAAHIYWAIRAKMLYIKKLRKHERFISILTYIPYVFTKGLFFYKKNSSLSYVKAGKAVSRAVKDGFKKNVIRSTDY